MTTTEQSKTTSSGAATDPEGPTGRLATWLAATTLNDVPASVREHAKHLMLDGIGCALVGAQLPVSRIGVEGVTALDDAGSGTLIGWGGRTTSAPSAAMLNSSFIQGFELDDYHPLAPLHANSLVLPAMLAAAPHVGPVSGARFLLGAILGYETGPRVGLALGGLDMISRGWHSGVVFGPLAAAASAGTLYGLDAGEFEDALGIGATQSGGLMSAQFESMVKRMQHGFASRDGLTAAALAASALACGGIPMHFAEQAAIAQTLMPDAVAALPADALKKRSTELASRYPDDPRAQLVRATALAEENQLGSAEVVLRRIMKMSWPARRFAETDVHKRAQAVLAVVLAYDHDRLDARELAHDLCGDKTQSDSWPILTQAKLCPQ